MEFSSNIILRQDWNLFFARIWRKVQQQFSYKINTRAHSLIFSGLFKSWDSSLGLESRKIFGFGQLY